MDGMIKIMQFFTYIDAGSLSVILPPIPADAHYTDAFGNQICDDDELYYELVS